MAKTRETILAQIKASLALSTSDNANEAANAAAFAQTLLLKHNVSEEELEEFAAEKNEKVVQIRSNGKNKYNRSSWYDSLAGIVGRANLCEVIMSGNGLIWVGKNTNLEVAQYIFENLVHDLSEIADATWEIFNYIQRRDEPSWAWKHGKTWKNSFYHGANQSVKERLNANLVQLKQADNAINAMVVHNDVELEDYIKSNFRLHYVNHNFNKDRSGFSAGKAAGNAVSFRSGIGAGGSSGPKLLNKG